MAKRRGSRYRRGQAHARLAEGQDARPPGVRDRRLHEGAGPARRHASARSCSASNADGELALRRQRRHRLQRARDRRAAREARAAARRDAAVRERAEDAEGAQGRRRLGRAEARRARSSSPSGRTTAICAHPSFQGLRDDKAAREVQREEPVETCRGQRELSSRTSTRSSGPDEGITKGDLLDYYRAVAPRARAAPARTGRSRCAAIPTARTARRSSRRTRRRTCPSGSRASARRSRRASRRDEEVDRLPARERRAARCSGW